jgi:K+-sensing histidine kinase KdpD
MSEATRIEQSLQSGEKEQFAFNQLLENCIQGYQMTYSNYRFIFTNSKRSLTINAEPDFIVQLLDKLINNAMEFSETANPIEISLSQQGDSALLSISNIGPLLPDKMSNELLNSMVSIRSQKQQDKAHLGLGLFIAKMICQYHQGEITIANRKDNRGVEVLVSLPIIKN